MLLHYNITNKLVLLKNTFKPVAPTTKIAKKYLEAFKEFGSIPYLTVLADEDEALAIIELIEEGFINISTAHPEYSAPSNTDVNKNGLIIINNLDGYGYGDGDSFGWGDGYGDGDSFGWGDGYGDGNGSGDGHGYGCGGGNAGGDGYSHGYLNSE